MSPIGFRTNYINPSPTVCVRGRGEGHFGQQSVYLMMPFQRCAQSGASHLNCAFVLAFCYALKSQILQDQVPQHYMNGKRKLSILHARIRNRCSNLHLDLYTNHLKDDPICDCLGGAESAEHYFFECQRFTAQRIILFNQT